MCADLLVEVESAYSVADAAAWALAERSPEVAALAGLAQAFCSDAFARAAADNIQIHLVLRSERSVRPPPTAHRGRSRARMRGLRS
ncbi:hypothetical protein ACWDKQ_17135 [Saccharopolyspora sp. NPDC000995]